MAEAATTATRGAALSVAATPTQRPRRSRASRVPAPIWLAAAAAIVCAVVFARLTGADDGQLVAVAARTVAIGEPLQRGDFRYISATLPGASLDRTLRPRDVDAIAGQVARHQIEEGELVQRDDVAPAAAPNRQRAVSIPVDPERAVGGRLQRGDVVDVVDATSGEAVYVVTDAEVLDTGIESTGRATGSGKYAVTLAVDDREALRLGAAVSSDKVYLVRSTGAPVAVTSSPSTTVRR